MWPSVETPADWEAVRLDDAALLAGVRAICAGHGLAAEEIVRCPGGSMPVYLVGERHALKLFPPRDGAFARVEALALAAVGGRLPLPTPELLATGTLDGWSYVLMSRLHGRPLAEAWTELTAADRDRLAEELGHGVAALHAIDVAPLGELTPDWGAFDFDFEPAMVGDPEYDFASFGVFVSCGDGRFLRRALRAYGYGEDALDEALPRRLLAHAILHRYSNLRWYLERVPAPGATTLDALAGRWWSLDGPTG